ncbi:MAG: hypothetical protein LBJ64_03005 [Deltaproteobacteria bacterium]|jgi:hypothetical protein|nr:hypothetical protein [Deltaproteobacteria bacterium]
MTSDASENRLPAPLSTLAIGSVPFDRTDEALDLMAENLDIPASPQMVALSPWEDMIFGALSGLPSLAIDEKNRSVVALQEGREEGMAEFYEKYYSGDLDFLALDERSSIGFSAFLARAEKSASFGSSFLKTQVVGPITLAQSVKAEGGAGSVLNDPSLLELFSLAMGGKAAWLAARLRALGREPIVFIDEPGLTGYGSAFSTLSAEIVLKSMEGAIEAARAGGRVLLGCHVCGNTDWGLLAKTGLDILNFDAYEYMETICLYPREMKEFLDKGGFLAFGVAPTREFAPSMSAADLADVVLRGWRSLAAKGLDPVLLRGRTLLTSACGLGSLSREQARGVMGILPEIKARLAEASILS